MLRAFLPGDRDRRRRLRTLVTLLRAPDPLTRIEALERGHALPPADRTRLSRMLRQELVASAHGPVSEQQAATAWFIRQLLGLLADSRLAVRMDAARVLRQFIGRTDSEDDASDAIAPAVATAVELAGGKAFIGGDREHTRVLAFAEMLEAGLQPVVIGLRFLEEAGAEELEPLTLALRDRSPRVRRTLCEVLAAMGGERAITMLTPLLQDPSPDLRARAAEALGDLKATAASAEIIRLLTDPIAQVRAAAATALARMEVGGAGSEIIAALTEECRRDDRAEATRGAMIDAIAVLAGGARADLAEALAELPRPVASRLAAAAERAGVIAATLVSPHWADEPALLSDLLAKSAELGVTAPFLEALDSADSRLRRRAAAALGHSHRPEALVGVAALLADPDGEVRMEAVAAVAHMADPRALSFLAVAAADPDGVVRRGAITGLHQVLLHRASWRPELLPADFDLRAALSEAHRALLSAAGDSQQEVRHEAAGGLGLFNSAEAAEALVNLALGDADETVRHTAAQSVAQARFPQTRRLLAPALDDLDPRRRARAMSVLGTLGGADARRHLLEGLHDAAPEVREASLLALTRMPVEGIAPQLVGELRNPDPFVRAGAAALLGKAHAAEYTDELVQALGDPEEEVRVNALNALAGLGRTVRRHQHDLTARLSDPSPRVREVAASVLGVLRESWAEAVNIADFLTRGALTAAGAATLVDMATEGDLDPLLRALDNPQTARSLAEFLAGPGWNKLGPMLAAIRQANERDQGRTLAGLAQALQEEGSATGYLAELRSIDPEVRLMAVDTAALLATPEAVEALIETLARDPVLQVRSHIISVLAEVSGEAAQAALLRAQTRDPSKAVRLAATRALGQLRGAPQPASGGLGADDSASSAV